MPLQEKIARLKYMDRIKVFNKTSPQVEEALANLRTKGYHEVANFLPNSLLVETQKAVDDGLKQGTFEMPCLSQTMIDPAKHGKLIDRYLLGSPRDHFNQGIAFDKSQFQSLDQVVDEFAPSTIKLNLQENTLVFLKVLLNEFVLDVAEKYFAIRPYLVEAYARRNYPATYKVMNHMWHRDTNNKFFLLKAFVFLSDCEITHGPHQFVMGSHKDETFRDKTYYHDDEIIKVHADKVKTSIVKAGTLILEDTRGLHRACVPINGERDLLYGVFFPLPFWHRSEHKQYKISNVQAAQFLDKRQLSYLT